jgi:hypothetical protein
LLRLWAFGEEFIIVSFKLLNQNYHDFFLELINEDFLNFITYTAARGLS